VKAAEAALAASGMPRPNSGGGQVPPPSPPFPAREQIEEILRRERGNVTRAAQQLGLHRNQLRRWLSRHEIDPRLIDPPHGTGPAASDRTGHD